MDLKEIDRVVRAAFFGARFYGWTPPADLVTLKIKWKDREKTYVTIGWTLPHGNHEHTDLQRVDLVVVGSTENPGQAINQRQILIHTAIASAQRCVMEWAAVIAEESGN